MLLIKDWKNTIQKGMELIQRGCRENNEWNGCADCPFDIYCTILMEDDSIENEVNKFEGIRWLPNE